MPAQSDFLYQSLRNSLALHHLWHPVCRDMGRGRFCRRAGKQTHQPVSRPLSVRVRRADPLCRARSSDARTNSVHRRPAPGCRLQPSGADRASPALSRPGRWSDDHRRARFRIICGTRPGDLRFFHAGNSITYNSDRLRIRLPGGLVHFTNGWSRRDSLLAWTTQPRGPAPASALRHFLRLILYRRPPSHTQLIFLASRGSTLSQALWHSDYMHSSPANSSCPRATCGGSASSMA